MKEADIKGIIELSKKEGRTSLHLSHRKMVRLPDNIKNLTTLRELDLSRNQIKQLPKVLYKLGSLEELSLNLNKICSLPQDIHNLSNVKKLTLRGNKFIHLPEEMSRMTNLTELDVGGNPLPKAPPEIIDKTHEPLRIVNYFLSIQKTSKKPLNEAKLIIVGQGGVGKTSLVKRIIYDSFYDNESKTDGINIDEWSIVNRRQEKVRINVWDFGGQEIMHSTHQFFLTKRSFYVIVIDARQGENESKLEYWLKMVRSFGDGSPAIVVINKTDQHPLDLNRKWLMSKYKFLIGFFDVSCKTYLGIKELKKFLANEVICLSHIDDELPGSWFQVKECLSKMKNNYISYEEYRHICRSKTVDSDFDQESLVELLHDLGIVINFIDDPRINDTNILNPEWVTTSVYTLLNSFDLFHSKGVLDVCTLSKLLDVAIYPKNKHQFIINLMEKFELCYKIDNHKRNLYLIPDLLRKEEPDYSIDINDSLHFQFHYDLLPNSIISRLMVRLHEYIYKDTAWRTGVVLSDKYNMALIKSDSEDKKIYIWVSGNKKTRRSFLHFLRESIRSINNTIPNLSVSEKVVYSGKAIDYKHLINLEALGEKNFIPEGLSNRVSVKMLLEGVDEMKGKKNQNASVEIIRGNKFVAMNVNSQGDHNSVTGEINQQNYDVSVLQEELRILREHLQNSTDTPGQLIEAAAIAEAEAQANEGNLNNAIFALKKAGKWSLGIAEKIGVPVATAAIKSSAGL